MFGQPKGLFKAWVTEVSGPQELLQRSRADEKLCHLLGLG
jgi:hypothetical protein